MTTVQRSPSVVGSRRWGLVVFGLLLPPEHAVRAPVLQRAVRVLETVRSPRLTAPSIERLPEERPNLLARIRYRVVDGATRGLLPARVVIRGEQGTPDPDLGPPHQASGARSLALTADGTGELRVPPGRYVVTFHRGIEWSLASARINLTRARHAEVEAVLERQLPEDEWAGCDLHVHSAPSGDSAVSIRDRVADLVASGVEFAAASEHNIVGDYSAGISALPSRVLEGENGRLFDWAPAVEVTTDHSAEPIGHFNVFPFAPVAGALRGGAPDFRATPRAIFRAARSNNPRGVIQVNHPRMEPGIGYFDRVGLDVRTGVARSMHYDPTYDAIEIFNGYFLGNRTAIDRVMQDWFSLLRTGRRYTATANSDSHVLAYQHAGFPRTYVRVPGLHGRAPTSSEVAAALRGGRAVGTNGPLLFLRVGEASIGETLHTRRPAVDAEVTIHAASWIDVDTLEVYRNGELFSRIAVPPSNGTLRFTGQVRVPIERGRNFLVVVARGSKPMDEVLPHQNARPFAFTNPVWIHR